MSKVPTGIPNLSGEEKQQLAAALSETSKSMARMTGEREYIREVVKKLSTDLKIEKKIVSRLVKIHYRQNFDEEVIQNDTIEQLYQTVIKKVS